MYLKRLSLLNYKNISEAELQVSSGINYFIGNNGVGKTNYLDAIYYLCFCKSRFGETDIQNTRHGETMMMLQGDFLRKKMNETIYCGLQKGKKKQFRRNKKKYRKLSDHIGLLPLVMISPADIELIVGGSEERRKFADGVISQYDKKYLEQLLNYKRLLFQRNKLLKDFHENDKKNIELISVFDQQLSPLSTYIYEARYKFCKQLIPIFQHYYNQIAVVEENIDLNYFSQLEKHTPEELFKNAFKKDTILQHTTVGIHRDDFILTINNYSIKKEGSQGQKKTYLVALKLAQYDFMKSICGFNPILILDDIFDKLDKTRVKQIVKIISDVNKFGQIFISDTNKENINKVLEETTNDYSIYKVEGGQATKYET